MTICPSCRREVGVFATGNIRPHHRLNSTRWCAHGVVRINKTAARRLVVAHGPVKAAKMLGTSPATLRRRFVNESWWPSGRHPGRYIHTGHAKGQTYKPGCDGCIAYRHDRYLASEEGQARIARRAEREAKRAALQEHTARQRELLDADRAFIALMVKSGQALTMRRALGLTAAEVETQLGIGRTALNKIEHGRRPAMARVIAYAHRYAALLRNWQDECERLGIDPTEPVAPINAKRQMTRHEAARPA